MEIVIVSEITAAISPPVHLVAHLESGLASYHFRNAELMRFSLSIGDIDF